MVTPLIRPTRGANDAACLDYLDWLRWPAGFRCPSCGCTTCWELSRGERRCTECRRRVSRTAGTIFQDTRTPLTVWFAAVWHLTTQKNGISALGLKRVLGQPPPPLGSYQTAWAMLHRYRTAMVRPGRERLNGNVEADESFFGGVKPGKRGEGQPARCWWPSLLSNARLRATDEREYGSSLMPPR